MRILFLHRDLPPDIYTGAALQVHRLANALVGLGHEVDICSHTLRPEGALYRTRPIPLPWSGAGLGDAPLPVRLCKRLLLPILYRRLDSSGYDVVHIHGDGAFLRWGNHWIRTFYGTAALEMAHAAGWKGRLAQGLSYLMELREQKSCRHCIGIASHISRHLSRVDRVIPCMLSDEPLPMPPPKSNQPSILYLGSLGTRKNGELALETFRELRLRFPELRFHYVGPARDRDRLRRETGFAETDDAPGLHHHTRISPERLTELYRGSWLYLCLSTYEGFGVGIIEAMANGCPVISTPHPGALELIDDRRTGWLAEPESVAGVAEQVLNDADLRLASIRNGLSEAKRFTPARVAKEYLAIYRHAAAGRNPLSPATHEAAS